MITAMFLAFAADVLKLQAEFLRAVFPPRQAEIIPFPKRRRPRSRHRQSHRESINATLDGGAS